MVKRRRAPENLFASAAPADSTASSFYFERIYSFKIFFPMVHNNINKEYNFVASRVQVSLTEIWSFDHRRNSKNQICFFDMMNSSETDGICHPTYTGLLQEGILLDTENT